ncbi:hypothetical protein [Paracidovorax avenae]|uniref:hypothetical protein n=1 Tax=Paracidovorax avenae TaxID=80867 RepID=UPI001314B37B|nr:hypothetical protein [Paracidovorax avenae]
MKIFDLVCDLHSYASFLLKDPKVWGDEWFDGNSHAGLYPIPIAERNMEENQEIRSDILPDFTQMHLRPIPTFSEKAIQSLGKLLVENGEFAPIEMDEPIRYSAFNTTKIVDILDEDKSEIVRFRSGGVMSVEKYVLLDSVTSVPPIFKIPQTRRNTVYVNEDFVLCAREHALTGFNFKLLFVR